MPSAASQYLALSPQFQLGALPTERRHPLTGSLSKLAKTNLPEALRLLHKLEREALKALLLREVEISEMESSMRKTLESGGRVFLCGCGATGRLSLAVESLWREQTRGQSDQVHSFMAGGDYALIRSIEKFEDHFDYGARQLRDGGFREGDLLIASTEGGETPFVIGAVEEASRISSRKHFFNFCNPSELLKSTVERSKRVLDNEAIISISIETGPMALAGSTRLQASSALMLAAGAALFSFLDQKPALNRIQSFLDVLEKVDFTALAPLVEKEAEIYSRGELCIHETSEYGITVVTDTTERTPTFSLLPFESSLKEEIPCWTYLHIRGAKDSKDAWRRILHRDPKALDWSGFTEKYGDESVLSFDFTKTSVNRRESLGLLHTYKISATESKIRMELGGSAAEFQKPPSLLEEHLLLKAALNFSSTLVMGRLGRFSSNLMLFVRATNNKLIDRSIRYVQALLNDEGIETFTYEDICETLFEIMPRIKPDEPIVLLTVDALKKKRGKSA